jgi:hypothetical protein
MKYTINYGTTEQPINIKKAEEKYGAKYIGDFCLKTVGGGWSEEPSAIFYQPNPNTELGHTHYFGLFTRMGSLYITKGDSAFEEPIAAIVGKDGEVVYSRYRHDFRTLTSDTNTFIDGGRDYCRRGGAAKSVYLTIDKDKLVVNEYPPMSEEIVENES